MLFITSIKPVAEVNDFKLYCWVCIKMKCSLCCLFKTDHLSMTFRNTKQVSSEDESRNKTEAVSTQNRPLCEQFNTKTRLHYVIRYSKKVALDPFYMLLKCYDNIQTCKSSFTVHNWQKMKKYTPNIMNMSLP